MELVASNQCDALERPRSVTAPARGLTAPDVRRLLAAVPDSVRGRRDRAILLTLVLTGRRRSEVINLKAGDVTVESETAMYSYRAQGGKTGRRELPRPAYEAESATLSDAGKALASMPPSGVAVASRGRLRRDHERHLLRHLLRPLPALPA